MTYTTTRQQQLDKWADKQFKAFRYSRGQLLQPFYKAMEIVRTTAQWPSGFWVEVNVTNGKPANLNGVPAQIFIKNKGGFLKLHMVYNGKTLDQTLTIGYMDYNEGIWLISREATEAEYMNWNKKIRKEIYNAR